MLLKECRRCGQLIPYGQTYCRVCAPIVDEERQARIAESKKKSNRVYNQGRDPKYQRFYNSADWRRLSARYLQDRGYRCEECGAIATQVHHRDSIQQPSGWDHRLDYNNLELVCTRCHNKKHNRFRRKQHRV